MIARAFTIWAVTLLTLCVVCAIGALLYYGNDWPTFTVTVIGAVMGGVAGIDAWVQATVERIRNGD